MQVLIAYFIESFMYDDDGDISQESEEYRRWKEGDKSSKIVKLEDRNLAWI